jgi:formyl-CoA transferase
VGVPCGPINDIGDVYRNPQVQARQMVVETAHPTAGTMKLVRSPMKMSATPTDVGEAPPLLGQHTEQVLRDMLGRSADDIATLRDKGVL